MTIANWKLTALLATLFCAATGIAVSQQNQGDPHHAPPDAAGIKRWEDSCKPGKCHKQLEALLGKWDMKMSMMGAPESAGTADCRWLIEGRWLIRETHGSMMGMKVDGFMIIGYDNFKQKYVTCSVDSFSTAMLTAEGTPDMEGKLFQSFGTMDEPLSGENDKMVRYVTRWKDADHYSFEVHDPAIGETNTKVIEMAFSRVKAK
ncbi:MAG: DUF1579 family protein [Planctomycetota bacterium]